MTAAPLLRLPIAADAPDIMSQAIETFLGHLRGQNRSSHTIAAYQTDLRQFVDYVAENSIIAPTPPTITRPDVQDFLSSLATQVSGATRARKLAAIREFFRALESAGTIETSPATSLRSPKREQKTKTFLFPDEYSKLLAAASGNPRDVAMLQVFLQCGLRVGELVSLTLDDVDLEHGTLHIQGKGQVERTVPLEKKATLAIRTWLKVRQVHAAPELFLNCYGQPITRQSVGRLLKGYLQAAGLSQKLSPHALRHTFGSAKYAKGVPLLQIQAWLGHKDEKTTQIYVHLQKQNERRVMEATSL